MNINYLYDIFKCTLLAVLSSALRFAIQSQRGVTWISIPLTKVVNSYSTFGGTLE